MELITKKTKEIIIRLSNESDIKTILTFHHTHALGAKPKYLQSTLENSVGISLVAYTGKQLLGHILVVPLSSQTNVSKEEAALICGTWALNPTISELLIREAMMYSWESGFHVLFSLENNSLLQKKGFQPAGKDYFAINIDKYNVTGVELSWKGLSLINKDLVLPKAYLPSIHPLNQFLNN
jgi:hypothetical protein